MCEQGLRPDCVCVSQRGELLLLMSCVAWWLRLLAILEIFMSICVRHTDTKHPTITRPDKSLGQAYARSVPCGVARPVFGARQSGKECLPGWRIQKAATDDC